MKFNEITKLIRVIFLVEILSTCTLKNQQINPKIKKDYEQKNDSLILKKIPNTPNIENFVQISQNLYSGSQPKGDIAFKKLSKIGIKTIVSVDGAQPQIKLANKYKLRYIHIPIGYDSVPKQAQQRIAKVIRQTKAPYYFHCHHGKHRGPAAVAIAALESNVTTHIKAKNILKICQTSPEYKGLWQSVKNYKSPPLNAKLPKLALIAKVDSLTQAMTKIDRTFDRLKFCKKNTWQTPPKHPDISPKQEALILYELLRETNRLKSNKNNNIKYDNNFYLLMKKSETISKNLHKNLIQNNIKQSNKTFQKLKQSCTTCHRVYRN